MTLTERFLKYVSFETASDEESESSPSSQNVLPLADYLKEELISIGIKDAVRDEFGYVYGSLPESEGCAGLPAIGFIAHMDTSPAVSGADIKPRIIDYKGGDIILSESVKTSVKDFPFLKSLTGQKLIVTDGTTLLGADDKAGIAEIVTLLDYFTSHPEVKHGKVCVSFTPDEEIGRGTEHFDIPYFGADFAYTVDGGLLGEVEYECFNAASAKFTVNGVNIHPGSAKNKMKNAVLIANELISMLPPAETPAHTEGYEGFYHVSDISGNESLTRINMIIRDHNRDKFEARKAFVSNVCDYLNGVYGEGTVEAIVKDSYYNMRDALKDSMFVVDRAKSAMLSLGITPKVSPIRGGTDGAWLSMRGLPCPNLSTGGANYHGVNELVSIDAMEKMVEVLKTIVVSGDGSN